MHMFVSSPQTSQAKKYSRIGSFFIFLYLAVIVVSMLESMRMPGPGFGAILVAVYASPLLFVGFVFFVLSGLQHIETAKKTKIGNSFKIMGGGIIILILHYTDFPLFFSTDISKQIFVASLLPFLGWLLLVFGFVLFLKDRRKKMKNTTL